MRRSNARGEIDVYRSRQPPPVDAMKGQLGSSFTECKLQMDRTRLRHTRVVAGGEAKWLSRLVCTSTVGLRPTAEPPNGE
eukprot:5507554-Pleurochrysis_carterae.AAC.3